MNKKQRQIVYDKFNGRCAYCGEAIKIKDMQVDHIIPQSDFLHHVKNKYKVPSFLAHLTEWDVNNIANLHPACRVCNKWKSSHDLEFFRIEVQEQVNRLNSYSANFRMAKKYGLIEEYQKPVIFYFETVYHSI
jgi:5-methylcytosine-specific restriction endonuclease McrA